MLESSLCRLCGHSSDDFVEVCEKHDSEEDLLSKISSCLQIRIRKNDSLPTTVCHSCCQKLDSAYEFYKTCHEAQAMLEKVRSEKVENRGDGSSTIVKNERVDPANEDAGSTATTVSPSKVRFVRRMRSTSRSDDDSPLVQPKCQRREKNAKLDDVSNNPRLLGWLYDYPWSCAICDDVTVKNLSELRDHFANSHQRAPIFKCAFCRKQYDRYRSFSRHVKSHYDPKKYTCELCGKSFAQRTTLQSHASVHTTEKRYSCRTCGKAFKSFNSLCVHNKKHLSDPAKEKYPCDVCKKEFSTKQSLETHRKIHTGERNFICDVCGKSFVTKGSLDYHLLSHTGSKEHACSTCGKTFKTARLLGKHSSLHSGIKPYQCDVCEKQFRERGALREHVRIHTGAMPYSCSYCGKSFRFKGTLTIHTRQHTGERPYGCTDCRRKFTNWANYNKHMKRIHHSRDTEDRGNDADKDSRDVVTEASTSRCLGLPEPIDPEKKEVSEECEK